MSVKTKDDSFRDWEGHVFGFGYGTGEQYTLAVLKAFLGAISERPYDYTVLEVAVTPATAWLLINALCKVDILEYGTSPRFGWLTSTGERLKAYVDARTAEDLYEIVCGPEPKDSIRCYPNACNCGPKGYQEGVHCENPFWENHRR